MNNTVSIEISNQGAHVSGIEEVHLGHPVKGPSGLEGIFAGWKVVDGRIDAWVDPLGMYPLFYSASRTRIIVADSILELIASGAPTELDHRALSVFLRIGWFLDEDTPFKSIKVLPAGGRISWENGAYQVDSSPPVAQKSKISTGEAVHQFQELFAESITRCIQSSTLETLVSLSGGRDSRHILLEMHAQGIDPQMCVTYNFNPGGLDDEALAAAEITRRLNQKHTILNGPKIGVGERLRTIALTSFCSDEHYRMLPLRDFPAIRRSCLVDGLGGDVLTRNGGLSNPISSNLGIDGDWKALAEHHIDSNSMVSGFSIEKYLAKNSLLEQYPRDVAVSHLAENIANYVDFADPNTAFVFLSRMRREIALAPAAVLSTAGCTLYPYLSMDIVNFTLSLPIEVTKGGKFHDQIIEQFYPALSDVNYADGTGITWGKHTLANHAKKSVNAICAALVIGPECFLKTIFRESEYLLTRKKNASEFHDTYISSIAAAQSLPRAKRILTWTKKADAHQ